MISKSDKEEFAQAAKAAIGAYEDLGFGPAILIFLPWADGQRKRYGRAKVWIQTDGEAKVHGRAMYPGKEHVKLLRRIANQIEAGNLSISEPLSKNEGHASAF